MAGLRQAQTEGVDKSLAQEEVLSVALLCLSGGGDPGQTLRQVKGGDELKGGVPAAAGASPVARIVDAVLLAGGEAGA